MFKTYCFKITLITLLIGSHLFTNSVLSQQTAAQNEFIDLKGKALLAQRSIDRVGLDSIADVMLSHSFPMESKEMAYANYFKSDALCKTSPQEAVEKGLKALTYFVNQGDHYQTARCHNVIAHSVANIGDHSKALEHYQQAIEYSNKSDNSQDESEIRYRSKVKYNAGFTMVRRGDLHTASKYLSEALKDAIELKDSIVMFAVLQQLGNIELYRKDYQKSLDYHQKSHKLALIVNPNSAIYSMTGIATCYSKLNMIDSAIYYHEYVLDLCEKSNNVTCVCVSLNNTAELYYDMGDYDKTIALAQRNLEVAKQGEMPQYQLLALAMLNNAHLSRNEPQKAKKYVDRALNSINKETEFAIAADVYEAASNTYEDLGQYRKALEYQKLFKERSDTLLNKLSLEKIEELKYGYELKEKEQQINQLQSENKYNAIASRQKIGLLIGLFSLLGLSTIVIYLWMKKRNLKTKREKENIEQRLLRSQLNPHFIFNAISSIQNYLFHKSDLKVGISYLSKFAHLMRQILENSREQYISLSEEMESLENYLELQKLRYGNVFEFKIEVDPSINPNELMIPPLIAQPFVENAIEHGMIYRVPNGHVTISFKNLSKSIQLSISDNGLGDNQIEIESKKSSIKKKSLSTIITKERLDRLSSMHKQKYDMVIQSLSSGGTQVIIQLPKIIHS